MRKERSFCGKGRRVVDSGKMRGKEGDGKPDVSNGPLTSQFISYAWPRITKKQRDLFGSELEVE